MAAARRRSPYRSPESSGESTGDSSAPQSGNASSGKKSSGKDSSKAAGSVRIIGGSLRGRNIPYNGDPRTRPMKDRVREAIFNLLGPDIQGKHVLDLFAGTGVLGFESVSRGALKATLSERHFPTSRSNKDNAEKLGVADRIVTTAGDSFVWVKRLESLGETPVVAFCSPPYSFFVQRQDDLLAMVARLRSLAPPGSIFVVESDERFNPALLPDADQWDVRNYPPTIVSILRT